MRRTRLAGASIKQLKEGARAVERSKKEYFNYFKRLNENYSAGKISYSRYVEILYQKRNGRNIKEWMDYLDKYEEEYNIEIKRQQRKEAAKKISVIFFSLSLVSLLIFLFYSQIQPSIVGFAVEGNQFEFSQKINAEFSQSGNYELQINETGKLSSLKLSGSIEGIGTVKIFLSDLLIYSGEINLEEVPQTDKTSPSQEELLPSEIIIKNFTDVCNETCDLKELNLSSPSYTLKIELSENMKLKIDEIKYTLIQEIEIQEPIPETNITIPTANESQNITSPAVNVTTNITAPEIVENITKTNITTTILTEENVTIQRIQSPAVIGQPVKWKEEITLKEKGAIKIRISKDARNINVNKINSRNIKEKTNAVSQTGQEIQINDDAIKYEIEYETPAPLASEKPIADGKEITITNPSNMTYENVSAFTTISGELSKRNIHLYKITEAGKEEVSFVASDKNHDGLADSIQWTVPELTDTPVIYQAVIEISKAEHLDSNRTFISDIYSQVSALDDVWSEPIKSDEYVRVTFSQKLDSSRDITLYLRITSESPTIKVYEKDGSELIAEFPSLVNGKNKVYLTNLQASQDTFDLQVLNGAVEIDYIVDPSQVRTYYLWAPSSSLRNFNISAPLAGRIANMSTRSFNATAGTSRSMNWTASTPYRSNINISNSTLLVATIYCNRTYQTSQATNLIGNITSVIWLDCGTSSTCAATGITICTNNSISSQVFGTLNGNCNSTAVTSINVTCNIANNYTMNYGDYLGLGISIFARNTSMAVLYNSSTLVPTRFNLSEADENIPRISVISPTNGTRYGDPNITFNITIDNEWGSFCNFSLDSNVGRAMTNLNGTYFNYTNTSTTTGFHNITFDCNDTFNNWNATTGFTYFTVNNAPNVTNISWITVAGSNSSNLSFGTTLDIINAWVIDSNFDPLSVNISIIDPDLIKRLNGPMSNTSYNYWNYSNQFTLDKQGIWRINVNVSDGLAIGNRTVIINVTLNQTQSTREGWYGYSYQNVTSQSEITDLLNYQFDLLELQTNYTLLRGTSNQNWTSIKDDIVYSYNANIRNGLNIVWNYNYSNIAQETNATANITVLFPDLMGDPYSITLEYISIELLNLSAGGYTVSQLTNTTNQLAEKIVGVTENKFPVFVKNYNNSGLDSAYVRYTPLRYITGTSETNLMDNEIALIRTNTTLNRIYIGLNSTLKARAQNTHNIFISLRSTLNSTSFNEPNIVSLNNLDVLVFNNLSTPQNYTLTISEIPITGKDVWDSLTDYVIAADTNSTFNVSIPGYSISVIYFEDLNHLTMSGNSTATAYKQSVPFTGNMNYTRGQPQAGSWNLDSNNDMLTKLFDPHYYIKTNFITYYGWLNASRINYNELCDNAVLIIGDKNNKEVDTLTANCTSSNEIYGYVSVFDYSNTDAWFDNKTAEVNNWTILNESMNLFIDGIDVGVGGTNFSSRMKDLVDYVQVQKGKKAILNTYTAYQNFSTWGLGGVMKESCVNRWNGPNSSAPSNYSREDWGLELNKSRWYQSHNIKVLCQSFNNRTTDGSNSIYNYTDLQNIYFASKVLGYDYFYLGQPDFNYAFTEYVYDTGNDLGNDALTNDNQTYYRAYSEGIIYYNISSKQGWIDDGRVIQQSQVCFKLYDSNSTNNVTLNFNINKPGNSTENGTYQVNDANLSAPFTWQYVCANISDPPRNGRYLIEGWVMPRSTAGSQGVSIGYADNINYSVYSYYDSAVTDSWGEYLSGRNWEVYVLLSDTKKASIDTTEKITQTNTFNTPTNITINISSTYPFNISIFSDLISVNTSLNNITYNGVQLNVAESDDCDSAEPTFANTTINDEIHGACRKLIGVNYSIRIKSPSLSERIYTIVAGAGAGDTLFPQISITYPQNSSNFSINTVNVNYTVSDNVGISSCWYSNDTYNVNTSLGTNCINITNVIWNDNIMHNVTVWVNDTSNNVNWSSVSFNVSTAVPSEPPVITTVYNASLGPNLNPGPQSTSFLINFTVYDINGDVNYSTAKINISLANEITRQNASCEKVGAATNYVNFTCNVTMFWYDGAGGWNITASIFDNATNFAMNGSNTLTIAALTGFDMAPANLSWNAISPGARNITSSNHPILMNNTGNQPIGLTTGNITINTTNLFGESNSAYALYVSNISVSPLTGGGSCTGAACLECSNYGFTLLNATYVNITKANLTKGNYTVNDGTGQEQLYFCIKWVGNQITPQAYSTSRTGIWIIKLLVAVLPVRKFKFKKKKKEKLQDDKLLDALKLIAEDLKKEYSLNKEELLEIITEKLKSRYDVEREEILKAIKPEESTIPIAIFSKQLGGLEAIVKYMKENLNMSYSEIAKKLGRNERTIWTSYKKAKEKQKETFIEEKGGILIPLLVFKNKELTIFESLISHLKEKEIKYSEIAKLLNRDQRNIRTIYIRTLDKKKRNV